MCQITKSKGFFVVCRFSTVYIVSMYQIIGFSFSFAELHYYIFLFSIIINQLGFAPPNVGILSVFSLVPYKERQILTGVKSRMQKKSRFPTFNKVQHLVEQVIAFPFNSLSFVLNKNYFEKMDCRGWGSLIWWSKCIITYCYFYNAWKKKRGYFSYTFSRSKRFQRK